MTSVRVHELRASLVELAERTYGQLVDLFKDATPERCEFVVRNLHEVSTVCRQLFSELAQGEPPNV